MGTRLGITCTDGKFWNEQRSFVIRHLKNIGYGKSIMEKRIHDEIREVLAIYKSSKEQPISPGENYLLATSVINILWTFITGSKIKRDDELLVKLLNIMQKRSKAFDMSGGLLGQMPWLRFIAPDYSGYNLIKNLNSEFYTFFMEIIDDHLKNYSKEKVNDDLIYAFIKEMKEREGQPNSTFTVKQLIMIILDIFIGGSQTTSTIIDLSLMTMVIYPEVQKRCQEEIEKVVKVNGKVPGYPDRHDTPYTDAMIHEVMRFFSIAPITGKHFTVHSNF